MSASAPLKRKASIFNSSDFDENSSAILDTMYVKKHFSGSQKISGPIQLDNNLIVSSETCNGPLTCSSITNLGTTSSIGITSTGPINAVGQTISCGAVTSDSITTSGQASVGSLVVGNIKIQNGVTPCFGKIIIGDGTIWHTNMSTKTAGGVTTDLFTFNHNGALTTPRNTLDDGLGNAIVGANLGVSGNINGVTPVELSCLTGATTNLPAAIAARALSSDIANHITTGYIETGPISCSSMTNSGTTSSVGITSTGPITAVGQTITCGAVTSDSITSSGQASVGSLEVGNIKIQNGSAPCFGKIIIGDGTVWHTNMSTKTAGGVTTDLFTFNYNGAFTTPRNTLDDGLGNALVGANLGVSGNINGVRPAELSCLVGATTNLPAAIATHTTEIAARALASDLATTNGVVVGHTAAIATHTTEIAARALAPDLAATNGVISGHTTAIANHAIEIASRAFASDLAATNGVVSFHTTAINERMPKISELNFTCGPISSGAITSSGAFTCGTNSLTSGSISCGSNGTSTKIWYDPGEFLIGETFATAIPVPRQFFDGWYTKIGDTVSVVVSLDTGNNGPFVGSGPTSRIWCTQSIFPFQPLKQFDVITDVTVFSQTVANIFEIGTLLSDYASPYHYYLATEYMAPVHPILAPENTSRVFFSFSKTYIT